MADKTVNFELLTKGLTEGYRDAGKFSDALKQVQSQLSKLTSEADLLGANIKKAFNNADANIKSVTDLIRGGGPNNSLTNASTKAQIDAFKADATQVFAQLTNSFTKGMKDFVRAIQNEVTLSFASSGPVGSASRSDSLVVLQAKRDTAAFQQAQVRDAFNKGQAGTDDLDKANSALAQTESVLKRVSDLEQRRNSNISQIAQKERDLATAQAVGDTKASARLEKDIARLNIQVEQVKQERGESSELDKHNAVLANILAREQAISLEKAKQATAAKSTDEVVARATTINNAKAGSPDYLASTAALSNAQTSAKLADGGANLFKIQAQLLGNYLALNQLFNLIQFGKDYIIQLDQAFTQLQAITATTNYEMVGLKQALQDVAEGTRFTTVQIAQAATVLGQAGFSAAQIKEMVKSVALFATATGTDLSAAVDITTSTLSVFNLTAGETGRVVNILTDAINGTKLTTEKLGLGLQYAGQVAAESGVEFEELVSVIGAFSQAGVRAGSTLGTGIRQLFVELQAPSAKLVEALRTVGLGLSDVDIRSQGVIGVFQNLKTAGFDAATAFSALDVRAAQAYAAISANIDVVEHLQSSFVFSSAAIEANATQLDSLQSRMDRFRSILGTTLSTALGPITEGFKVFLTVLSAVTKAIGDVGPVVALAGAALTGAFGGAVIARVGSLASNLFTFGQTMKAVTSASTAFEASLAFLLTPAGIGAAITLAATAIGYALSIYNDKFPSLSKQVDTLKGQLSESEGRLQAFKEKNDAVGQAMVNLIDKADRLNSNQNELAIETARLKDRFGDWGLTIEGNVTSVDKLTEALGRLQQVQRQQQLSELLSQVVPQENLIQTQIKKLTADRGLNGLIGLGGGDGFKLPLANALLGGQGTFDFARSGTQPNGKPIDLSTTPTELLKLNDSFIGFKQLLNDFLQKAARDPNQAFAELRERAGRQGINVTGTSDQAVTFAQQLLTAVDARAKSVGEIYNAKINQDERGKRIDLLNFDSATSRQGQRDSLVQDRESLTGLKVRLDKGDKTINEDGKEVFDTVDVAVKRAIRDEAQAKVTELEDQIKALKDQGAPAGSDLVRQAEELKGLYLNLANDAQNAVVKQIKDTNKFTIADLEAQIKQIKTNTTKFTPIEDVFSNMDQAVDLFNKERTKERELKENELAAKLRTREISSGERDQSLAEFDNETLELGDKLKGHFETFIDNTKHTLEKTNEKFDNITPQVEAFTKRLKLGLNEIDAPQDARRRQEQLFSDPRFENKFSQVQIKDFQRQTQLQEPAHIQSRVDFFDQQLPTLTGLRDQTQATLADVQARKDALNVTIDDNLISGKRLLSEQEAKDTVAERNSLTGEETKLKSQLLGVETQIATVTDQRRQDQEKLNDYAAVQKLRTDDLNTALKKGSDQFLNSIGANKDVIAGFSDDFVTIMGAANNGFQGFVRSVATGSDSIIGSMKKLAGGILDSMLQIATNKLAASFFGFALGSIFGGGGAAAGGELTAGTFNFLAGSYRGGLVGLAGGGGVSNRDSVLRALQPGEYVLRESAVSAIGARNLDQINAAGASYVSQSRALSGAMAPKEVKPSTTNVWVVHPDQVPPPSANDIIAIVGNDIARGGTTKKLIKTVMQGA